jgi:large subunit ribosomal protein L4
MPTVKQFNFEGEVVGDFQLSEAVFAAPVHAPAMHQVVVAQLANRRVGTHDTKDRGDVAGGGHKPWRQKHTGRARAGSNRSPIWVGGGVAHGPHPRDYSQKVNKKVRRIAIRSALTLKVKEEAMLVVESFALNVPRTKTMLAFLEKVGTVRKSLIVTHDSNGALYKSASNIPGARVLHVDSINVYDILHHDRLLATPEAIRKLEEVFSR